jgi:membrane protein implicated in regulation of membrane protease activity
MSEKVFDRETLLDLTVNFIPLGILFFFIVAFAVFAPWGTDPLISSLQFGIVSVTFVLLSVLTYYAGKAVSKAEKEMEAEQAHDADAS